MKQTWKSMHYYTNTHKELNGSLAKKSENFKVKSPIHWCGLLEIQLKHYYRIYPCISRSSV